MLRSAEEIRHLTPQLMEILLHFVRHPGQVISKRELLEAVWPDTAVEEGALARCISELRSALGDSARRPQFIRTVVKRGYLLVATVEPLEGSLAETEQPIEQDAVENLEQGAEEHAASQSPTTPAPSMPTLRRSMGLPRPAMVVLALTLLLIAGLALWAPWNQKIAVPSNHGSKASIAVLAIANLSQDPDRQWMSTAFEEMLTTDLRFSDELWVIPSATVAEVRRQLTIGDAPSPEALRHLFATLGVDYGLIGSFRLESVDDPERVLLDLQLTFKDPATVAATVTEAGDAKALAELSLLAGTRLRGLLTARERLATEHWSAGIRKSSGSAEAYFRGLAAWRQSDPQLASELLTTSLRGAPVNPWGHHALAHALSAVGRDTEAQAAVARALEQASDLPPSDRLRLEADAHALLGHWESALARYRELRAREPHNLENGLILARALLQAGPAEAAEAALAALRDESPEPWDPRWLVLTSEMASALERHQQALATASYALELAESRSMPRVAATARLQQARALHPLGHLERAQATATAAARDFTAVGDRGSALEAKILLSSFLEQDGKMVEAEGLQTEILAAAREIGNVRLETAVLPRLAQHHWDGGDQSRAEALFERSIALRREVGDRQGEASVLTEYAAKLGVYGSQERVSELLQQALAIYRELGDPDPTSGTLVKIGRQALLQSEVSDAIPPLEEAAEIQRQMGNPGALANTLLNLGYARAYTGDVDVAIRALEEAVALSRRRQPASRLAVCLEGLGFARMLAGDMQGAENDFRASLSHLTRPWLRARVQAGLAWVHLAAGNLGNAEQTARAAIATAKESGYLPVQLIAHSQLTEVLFTRGKLAEAHREMQAMMETAYPTDYWTVGSLFRGITLARVTGAAGDTRQARKLLEKTVQVASKNGAETLVLEASLARYELARSDGSRLESELAELEARAASLGLTWLERRARELAAGA